MDDISFSSDDGQALQNAFETTILALQEDGFEISLGKLRPPSSSMDIFNCDLSHGKSIVRDERIEQFLSTQPNPVAEEAFVAYCATVKAGNSR